MDTRSSNQSRMKTLESRIYRKVDVRFGGGPTEQGCHQQHLAGGLPSVAVVPFPTAMLARYLENPSEQQTAIAIYTGLFLVGGLLVNLTWLYASHNKRLLDDAITPAKVRKLTQNYLPGPILYFIAFVLSYVAPLASVILIALINVFYAVSPLLAHWLGARRHAPAESDRAARTG